MRMTLSAMTDVSVYVVVEAKPTGRSLLHRRQLLTGAEIAMLAVERLEVVVSRRSPHGLNGSFTILPAETGKSGQCPTHQS